MGLQQYYGTINFCGVPPMELRFSTEDSSVGYVLEVNLEIDPNLRDYFNDYSRIDYLTSRRAEEMNSKFIQQD